MKKIRTVLPQHMGFTLIELILYIGLLAICISGVILFAWDIVYAGAKSSVQLEINSTIRLASKRIAYEIRNASAINSVTTSDVCLASTTPTRNPTRIYVSNDQLRIGWGGGSTDCTNIANDESLTSNHVVASNLQFAETSSGPDSYGIHFSLTVSKTGVRNEWQESQSYEGSAELRSN